MWPIKNKLFTHEWLEISKRHLETAILLFSHNHYTDVIVIEIHQALEKAFKAAYGFYGINIPRTHALLPLFEYVVTKIELADISVDDILIISDYYETDRYPGPKYFSPSNEETSINIDIATRIYNAVEQHFNQYSV